MCDVSNKCKRTGGWWLQVALPPRITEIDGDNAGRNVIVCTQHMARGVRELQATRDRLLAGTHHAPQPVTVKRYQANGTWQ